MAHLYRSILEGIAYEYNHYLTILGELLKGVEIREVRGIGGGSKSPIWNQIFADILGIEVSTLKTTETTALGAAICAAKGSGVYHSFQDAIKAMVRIDKNFLPDSQKSELYNKLYSDVYSKFYDRVQDLIRNASSIVE